MATKQRQSPAKKGAAKPAKRGQKKKKGGFPFLKVFLILAFLGILAGAAIAGGGYYYFSRDLPSINSVEDYSPKQVSRVLDREGNVLASWTDDERLVRTVISADEMAPVLRQAFLAAEDSSFYEHKGLDYIGLLRAVYTNLRRGELSQGASTITQQVVKNLVLSPERTIRRKVQEALLAFELDRALDKDDILTIYLNEVFFGVHFYGVEEASLYYFGRSAKDLELHQAALLGGLVQSPNRYNPFRHPDRALDRRRYVLRRMYDEGYIVEGVYREALEMPLDLVNPEERRPYEGQFSYYVDAVRRELLAHKFKEEELDTAGLRIHTALDLQTQLGVEKAVTEGLRAFDSRHGFHTPFRKLADEAAIERFRREFAGDVESEGLRTTKDYRGVILRSDDDATVMGIGPYLVTLERTPQSRMRPDPEKSWAEYFPVGSAFTVRPVGDYPASALSKDDGGRVVVRLALQAQASAVVMDPNTREVLGLTGGYAFINSSFNRAVQARRQTGSTFKIFVYGAALHDRAITPSTILYDIPYVARQPNGQTWQPQNADSQFRGPMTARTGLALSRNITAVRTLELIGLDALESFLELVGMKAEIPNSLTVALGSAELTSLEMTNAVATIAANGKRGVPVLVREVVDHDGTTRYRGDGQLEPSVDERVAWLLTSMLRSVVDRGTGRRAARLPFQVVGKTGSTNDTRDAWFTGWSTERVATVWVGYDQNVSLGRGESGGSTALPIWIDLMRAAHEGRKPADFPPPPSGIVPRLVDEQTDKLAPPGFVGGVTEYYISGTEPKLFAPVEGERDVTQSVLRGGGATTPIQPGFETGGF